MSSISGVSAKNAATNIIETLLETARNDSIATVAVENKQVHMDGSAVVQELETAMREWVETVVNLLALPHEELCSNLSITRDERKREVLGIVEALLKVLEALSSERGASDTLLTLLDAITSSVHGQGRRERVSEQQGVRDALGKFTDLKEVQRLKPQQDHIAEYAMYTTASRLGQSVAKKIKAEILEMDGPLGGLRAALLGPPRPDDSSHSENDAACVALAREAVIVATQVVGKDDGKESGVLDGGGLVLSLPGAKFPVKRVDGVLDVVAAEIVGSNKGDQVGGIRDLLSKIITRPQGGQSGSGRQRLPPNLPRPCPRRRGRLAARTSSTPGSDANGADL